MLNRGLNIDMQFESEIKSKAVEEKVDKKKYLQIAKVHGNVSMINF